METLQFANAKIRDVSQTANNSNGETPAEKIVSIYCALSVSCSLKIKILIYV